MKPQQPIEDRITPYIEAGLNSSFFTRLSDGNLARKYYDAYLVQDNIYLGVYKLALSRIALQTDCAEEANFFTDAAASISYEPAKQKQDTHLRKASKNNLNYIDYLLTYCHADTASAIASVYACFYFYHVVACELNPNNDDHPYCDWFGCYTGDIFSAQTQTITQLVNHHFDRISEKDHYLEIIQKGFALECDFHRLEGLGA